MNYSGESPCNAKNPIIEKIFQEWDVVFDRPRMQTLGLLTADGIYSNLGLLLSG